MMLLQLSTEQLSNLIRDAIENGLSKIQPSQRDRLLTRKQAIEQLDITYPTLGSWEKTGKIKATRIGKRVYFKESDLLNN